MGQRNGVAHRDEFRGALAGHDACHLCNTQYIAFAAGAFFGSLVGFGIHADVAVGDGAAGGIRLARNIYHHGVAFGIKMIELAHITVLLSVLRGGRYSRQRISASIIRGKCIHGKRMGENIILNGGTKHLMAVNRCFSAFTTGRMMR